MSAFVNEVHLGLGSFELDHAWDDSIAAVLQGKFCHLVIYWGEDPWYAGVVTSTIPGKDGLTIKGRGLDWWLGMDSDGPVFRDVEYIAGTNKLSNGDFRFGDDLWRVAEGTLWTVNGSAVFAGGSLLVDDELEVDETFPARPGHVYRSALTVTGGGAGGLLRLRTTYRGRFQHPNLLTNPGFELTGGSRAWSADTAALSIVADASEARSGTRVLRASSVAKPQLVDQPSFEDGGAGWGAAAHVAFVDDEATARTGTWAMRLGPIDKPQLMVNPSFEDPGGWTTSTFMSVVTDATKAKTGTKVLRVEEIAKPQLLANPSFEGTANWGVSVGGHLNIVTDGTNALEGTGVLKVSPITQPQLLTNPGFESSGTGWTLGSTGEFSVPLSVPENVFEGSLSLKAGPVDRDTVIPNGDFESSGLTGWDPTPIPQLPTVAGDWFADPDRKFAGGFGATTTGGGPEEKWLRSMRNAPPDDYVPVNPGERYRFEAKVRSEQDDLGVFDGEAHISVVFSATPGGTLSTWITSGRLKAGAGIPGWDWNDLFVEFEIPDDMLCMYPHLVIQGHTKGYWTFDAVKLFKLRDNVAEAYSNAVAVEQDQTYEFSAMVKSDVAVSQGEVQLRVELSGPSVETQHATSSPQGSTKRKGFSARDWVKIGGSFRVDEGYTTAKVFVVARDVLGGSFRVDNVELRKTSNNTDEIIAFLVDVVPKQRYEVSAMVRSGTALKGGTVHVRTRFFGVGKPDIEHITTARGATKNKWERIATTVTPPKGYTSCIVSVVATDVLGDFFWVDRVELHKDSNNTDSVNATAFFVTPEQSYRVSAQVLPSEGTTEGSVFLRVRLYEDDDNYTTQESPRVGRNEDMEWVETSITVRPNKDQFVALVTVVGVDVEGDPLYVDDVLFEKADNNSAVIAGPAYDVVAGSRYRLVAHVRSDEAASRGEVSVGVVLTGAGVENSTVSRSQRLTDEEWTEVAVDVTVQEGYDTATLHVTGADIDGAYFWVDDLTLTKMTGNSEAMTGPAFVVTPERRYRWTQWVRSDGTEVLEGNVRLGLRFTATGRDDVVVQSTPADGEGDEWKQISFDFTPPSGYALAAPSLIATDVAGGYFWADDGDVRDTDNSTSVHDLLVGAAGSWIADSTAPAGAEKVQISLVAEAGAPAYTVTLVSLSRVGGPDYVAAIVDDLLRDPVSGEYTCLTPGTVVGNDAILYDWVLHNVTARQALLDLCRSGVALPEREFRVRPDFTFDFGTATDIFDPRPEIVLVEGEAVLLDAPTVEQSAEGLITDVTVIGADRETPSGTRRTVEGTATAATDAIDRFGNPVRRSRVASEPSIAHAGVADSYAAHVLEQANAERQGITVGIADWRAMGGPDPATAPGKAPTFAVGDWVEVYMPEAGLENSNNERRVRGRVVFPVAKRVASRRTRLGPQFRAELIPPTGDPIPLPGVLWEPATSATLDLGDLLPEFATDGEGGSLSAQFTRWRASRG